MHDCGNCEENSVQNGEDHLGSIRRVHDASSHSDWVHAEIMQIPLFELFLIHSIFFLNPTGYTSPIPGKLLASLTICISISSSLCSSNLFLSLMTSGLGLMYLRTTCIWLYRTHRPDTQWLCRSKECSEWSGATPRCCRWRDCSSSKTTFWL